MVKTSEVFTPTKPPTFTSVKRDALWDQVDALTEQGGAFISVMGTTKLGKSTLVKSVMKNADFNVYIPGQNLASGSGALWTRLASELGIPTSTTSGRVVGDKSKWGFMAKFGITFPGVASSAGAEAGGEHHVDQSSGSTYEMDTPSAVAEAMRLLAADAREKSGYPPIIVIDDFHFVIEVDKRRELILALRPLAESDVTVILATLPGREDDPGFDDTNVGGRHYPVTVPRWDVDELREIATTGFKTLNVTAAPDVVDSLIEQSNGSPQIMQQLCLNLCRTINKVKDDQSGIGMMDAPDDWTAFFRLIKDPHSTKWLRTLGLGLTQRKPRKVKGELPDGRLFDGYQLILWALHQMGAPSEVSFVDLRAKINELPSVAKIGVGRLALEQKAKNMNLLASREMMGALDKHAAETNTDAEADDEASVEASLFTEDDLRLATLIPQPVFEVTGVKASDMKVIILDPLLAYTLSWHPEAFDR